MSNLSDVQSGEESRHPFHCVVAKPKEGCTKIQYGVSNFEVPEHCWKFKVFVKMGDGLV